jgi:thymidine kinase
MGSSKTAQLLMQRYNLQQLGLKVAVLKPAIDTRAEHDIVYSRVGLQAKAEIVLQPDHSIKEQLNWLAIQRAHNDFQFVLVDEAQFLSAEQVQELADLSLDLEIYCYGLRTDFRGQFFPGSAALFRLAEDIQEVPGGLCWCGKKATMNTRVDPEGNVIREGEQVLIDNQQDIRYMGLCYRHHREGKSHA